MKFVLALAIALAPFSSYATRGAQPNPQWPSKFTRIVTTESFVSANGPATRILTCVVGQPQSACLKGPAYLNADLIKLGKRIYNRGQSERLQEAAAVAAAGGTFLLIGIGAVAAWKAIGIGTALGVIGDVGYAVGVNILGITVKTALAAAGALITVATVSTYMVTRTGAEFRRQGQVIQDLANIPNNLQVAMPAGELEIHLQGLKPIAE